MALWVHLIRDLPSQCHIFHIHPKYKYDNKKQEGKVFDNWYELGIKMGLPPPPRKGEGNHPSHHPMFHVHEITYTIYPFRKLHSNLDSSYCCIGLFIVLLANPVRSYDSCFFTGFGTVSEAAIRYLKFSKDEK